MKFSAVNGRNRHSSSSCVTCGVCSHKSFQRVLSLASGDFFICVHCSVPSWIFERNPPQIFQVMSASLSLPVLCSVNSSCFGLLRQPAPSPQFKESTELCLSSLTSHYDLLTFPRQQTGTCVKLALLLSLWDRFSLSDAQCLKPCCLIYFAWFSGC